MYGRILFLSRNTPLFGSRITGSFQCMYIQIVHFFALHLKYFIKKEKNIPSRQKTAGQIILSCRYIFCWELRFCSVFAAASPSTSLLRISYNRLVSSPAYTWCSKDMRSQGSPSSPSASSSSSGLLREREIQKKSNVQCTDTCVGERYPRHGRSCILFHTLVFCCRM